jgi:hypothetical protein
MRTNFDIYVCIPYHCVDTLAGGELPQVYHPPSSQWFGTDMAQKIYNVIFTVPKSCNHY